MNMRIQMNTYTFTKVAASLAILSLTSLSMVGAAETRLGSSLTYLPDPEDFSQFEAHQYLSKPLVSVDLTPTQTIGYALIAGTKADTYFKNTTGCFERYTNWTDKDYPPFMVKMNDPTRSTWTKVNDVTAITKVASNHLWVCNNGAQNFMDYVHRKQVAFNGFTNFMTGFFQNLLAKVISINNIYTAVQNDNAINNVTGLYYDIGRMTRTLLDFEPIEQASFLEMIQSFINGQLPSSTEEDEVEGYKPR